MDIDNVPEPVWQLLALKATEAANGNESVLRSVDNYFYDHIYRRWTIDFQKIDYTSNMDGVKDIGWADVAKMWEQDKRAGLGKDQSRGLTAMQTDDNDPTHKGTRLGEKYSNAGSVSRFQFLVSSGGGLVLLNRMRRACQSYIADKNATVVQWWKVFGESFADQGQSDACVVYLLLPYDDPRVTDFIDGYLWPNVKDIINDRFVPVGLVKVGDKPFWGTWIPSEQKWGQVLGAQTLKTHYGSAGGLMGLVFGHAFGAAAKSSGTSSTATLIQTAKENSRQIIARLS